MFKYGIRLFALAVVCSMLVSTSKARDTELIEPQKVQVTAEDGLTLVGYFYNLPVEAVAEGGSPAVLILPGHNGDYLSWSPMIKALLDAGFHVLAVDERSMGGSVGKADWVKAAGDVQIWLDWLKTQTNVRPDKLATSGVRIGAHLAINGCTHDPACFAAFALSSGCVRSAATNCSDAYKTIPGLEAVSEMSAEAVASADVPPILMAASQNNPGFTDTAKTLAELSRGQFTLHLYTGLYTDLSRALVEEKFVTLVPEWLTEQALET